MAANWLFEIGARGYTNASVAEVVGDEIEVAGVDETARADCEAAIAAHTPDPDYGKHAEDKNLGVIRAKAQAVFDGTDTFTTAQLQKIAAAIILRATRG